MKSKTETLAEFAKNDLFARFIGIELLEISAGRALAKLEIKDSHLNGVGIAHGGAIFTLADLAFAAAANSYGDSTVAVAINVNVSYIKAAGKGTLYAEAVEISKSAKIGTYSAKITNEKGELIASFQGMGYRKSKKLQ
ncbi:hotdog fold thioesterase [Desulfobacterales bacterium HSG16]|nr:hotdog fold thioesterase [Desulfobacterales bacterium HSG16]